MWENLLEFFVSILLLIDSLIYSLISWVYQIILVICQVDILYNTNEIDALMNRLYLVIGVVILFLMAYSLLKSMVNPDNALKDKKSPVNIIKDVIISVVLIALVPSIFSFATRFQNAFLMQNTIGRLILGTSSSTIDQSSNQTIEDGGIEIASNVLQAFLHPVYSECSLDTSDYTYDCSGIEIATGNVNPFPFVNFFFPIDGKYRNYDEIWEDIKATGNFLSITSFSYSIAHESKVTYYYLVSTAVGVFVLLVLLSYCIDVAVRTVKLAVFQLIAPLPILARILPGEQGKKIFSNWIKATLSTYAEVFIRLAILFFAVLLIKIVTNNLPTLLLSGGDNAFIQGQAGFTVYLFAQLFIILGIILFVKQAPGLIKEITGLDGGKYNVFKSAAQGLSLIGGTVAGRSPLGGLRAWEEAGKDGGLKGIGHQANRRLAKLQAKAEGANLRDRWGDRLRTSFGYGTSKEAADRLLEKNRDLNGNYFRVNNDTASDINLRDENGNVIGTLVTAGQTGIELSENTIQRLNEAKSKNAIAISQIAEEAKALKDITEVNTKANVKGAADDLAKSEMGKGKYWLRDENGNLLTFTSDNGTIVGTSIDGNGNTIGWTQKQWEDWFTGNKERMNDSERARATNLLDKSINDYTVKSFYNSNGRNTPNGDENADAIRKRDEFAQQLRMVGVLNENGQRQSTITVDGRTINLDHLSQHADQITYQDLKDIKKYVEDVNGRVGYQLNDINHRKELIDFENAAISRIENQAKERAEAERAGTKYQAARAASDANNIEDRGKKS